MQAFRHSPVWGLASLLASQKAFATQSKEEQTWESTLSILVYWVSKGTKYHVMLFFNKFFQVRQCVIFQRKNGDIEIYLMP
jgi:hypothetical protein